MITKENIKAGLKKIGLKKGDSVIVHSSLSSIGMVEGGAETVIKALQEVVSSEGLLMMPYPLGNATIAKIFSTSPGVLKSFHPTHSVAAWGKDAEKIIEDHIKSPTACGKNTPYGRLIDRNGRILLLGVDQDRNTILHTVEEYANLPYLSDYKVKYIDKKGRGREKVLKKYPGPHRNFIGVDRILKDADVMKIGTIGNAVVRLIKAKPMVKLLLKELRKNPALFLCDNPNCIDCVIQRGKISKINLKNERFTLSAVSDEISDNPEEIITALNEEGIKYLELRNIYGQPVLNHPDDICNNLNKMLTVKGMKISGIDPGITVSPEFERNEENINLLENCIIKAEIFDASYLVLHPSGRNNEWVEGKMVETLKFLSGIAEKRNIVCVLENTPGTYFGNSKECLEILKMVNSPCMRLAFNPAHFVLNGEKPFLDVSPSIRKWIYVFYVDDALFTGSFDLPGYGNAEIKELISIMRCRSFDGFLSLKPGLTKTLETFYKSVRALQRLLETM
ncbi:MAG: AAC(3) family N-acetyltransferase [Candidatus Ratteibacteria bacterium]|nr:AAC(3) family N-acetyltransferase [Candidatus Ratteibacteria bacterium]